MEDSKVQKILIYTDFTEVGERSVLWGIFLAKKFKKELYIIHVINENSYNYFSKENIKHEAQGALLDLSNKITEDHHIKCDFYVEEGCTCTIINSEAERIDAFMILLGTHGKNDPQYLSGSSAIKIIRKSRIPYFVIQKNSPVPDDEKVIVLPMDLRKENKEKVGWATYFAKNVLTNIDILYYKSKDNRIEKNVLFATQFFKKFNIVFNKLEQTEKNGSINNLAVKYADDEKAFMIVVITTKKETLWHKFFGFPEVTTIANKKGIPVLCINPKKDLYIPCI